MFSFLGISGGKLLKDVFADMLQIWLLDWSFAFSILFFGPFFRRRETCACSLCVEYVCECVYIYYIHTTYRQNLQV